MWLVWIGFRIVLVEGRGRVIGYDQSEEFDVTDSRIDRSCMD